MRYLVLVTSFIPNRSGANQVLATVAVGLSLVIMTSVSGLLVDKAGRRSLMVIGTVTMGLALGFLSLTLFTLNSTPYVQGWLVSIKFTEIGCLRELRE